MNMYLFPQQWWHLIDPLASTLLVFSSISGVQKTNLITPNTSSHSKSLFGASFAISTAIKTINHYANFHEERFITKLIDTTADIIMMPATCNLWNTENNAIAYGLYLGFILGIIPTYTSKVTSDLAKLINNKFVTPNENEKPDDSESDHQYYTPKVLKSFTPAFVRGVVFFELNKILNNAPLSAFIAGSIRSHMLDTSKDVSSMTFNVMIDSINAAANRISFLKIFTPVDLIIDDSSQMLLIEFIEFFVRHSKFKNWWSEYHSAEATLTQEDKQASKVSNNDLNNTADQDILVISDIIDYNPINQNIMIANEL